MCLEFIGKLFNRKPDDKPDKFTVISNDPKIEPTHQNDIKNEEVKKEYVKVSIIKDLVVDDSSINRVIIKKYLSKFGRIGDEANNGQMALDVIAKNGEYNVIWMDVQMPVMNGIKCTEELRKMNYKGHIIGITGHVDDDSVQECKRVGMNDILAKPIDRKIFEAYIEKYKGI